MRTKREKKNVIIVALLATVAAMSIGYATLAQQLTIKGTAQVTGTWDIQMTSISDGTASNSAGLTSTASNVTAPTIIGNTTAIFDVEFKTPGDTMEYDIVVSNLGSITAKLNNVTATTSDASGNNVSTTLTEANGINYEIKIDGKTPAEATGTTLPGKNGSTISKSTIHVKVWWDAAATIIPEITTKKLNVTLEYVQV